MRERELGDRLADHPHQRLRALERGLHLGGPPAAPEREGGAGSEGREAVELGVLGALRVEGEPERGGRRLSERKRVQQPGAGANRSGLEPLQRAPHALGRFDEIGRRPAEPVRGDKRRDPVRIEPPERPACRSRRLRRDADDLLGRLLLVAACREGLAEQLELATGQRLGVVSRPAVSLEPERERQVRGRRGGQGLLLGAEGKAGAVELEQRSDPAVDRDRHEPCDRQLRAGCSPAHLGRSLWITRCVLEPELAPGRRGGGEPAPQQLGGQRSRARVHGARNQLPLEIHEAGDDQVGARAERHGPQERTERRVTVAVADEPHGSRGEGRQRASGRLGRWGPTLARKLVERLHAAIIAAARKRAHRSAPVAGGARSGENPAVAAPAPRRAPWKDVPEENVLADDPPLDPHAVRRRLRRERAKRHALHEHQRERRLAGIRFLALIGFLIFLTLFLSLSIWETIGSVFGL